MLVRQDFTDLPPKMFMMQILDNITKIYIYLWDSKDSTNRINITWSDLTKSHNKNSFRTSLRKLNNEGLLSYQESAHGVCIELVGWDDLIDD